MLRTPSVLIVFFLIASAACTEKTSTSTVAGKTPLLDIANMDTTVNPGEDFYQYANGVWLGKNPIPPTHSSWGSFHALYENNVAALRDILDQAVQANAAKGSPEQKVGDFYASGMDSAQVEKAGLDPLREIFQRIDGLKDPAAVFNEAARLYTEGIGTLYSFNIENDDRNATKYMAKFRQGGLGLPDRDYYFNNDERTRRIRDAYRPYITRMLILTGVDSTQAPGDADAIIRLETALAQKSMTQVEQRDPLKTYNKFSLASLQKAVPAIDWTRTFATHGIREDSCMVAQPEFFREAGKLLRTIPLETWKKYLRFHTADAMAAYLPHRFASTAFDFRGTVINGQEKQQARWKRVLQTTDNLVGELLGQLYVEKHFKPEAKQRMLELVANLESTFAERIERLDWMSDTTKTKALEKLGTFVKKIGYPEKWKDYSALSVGRDTYAANVLAAGKFLYNYQISKLGRPVDRHEWLMTPPTVNAYYNPALNEIVFPAGILQFPFFDMNADDAINYGAIGAVIGHEITHGFDDYGRHYDAHGNLDDWWTSGDAARFNERAGVVVRQFDSYTVLDSLHVNGKLTLGENLADLGGVAMAYEAFKKTKQGQSSEKIDGFSPDQRFFLSWAQVWRMNTRPENIAARIITDPHSPGHLRVNGPLSNLPEFHAAFGVRPGQPMYRPDSVRAAIW